MERRGGRKPPEIVKKRFDFGRSESGSDYLIARRRPLSAPSGSTEFGRNPDSKLD
jgi:hypothetical protein